MVPFPKTTYSAQASMPGRAPTAVAAQSMLSFRFVPTAATATMITTAINATMMAYSTAVAPASSPKCDQDMATIPLIFTGLDSCGPHPPATT